MINHLSYKSIRELKDLDSSQRKAALHMIRSDPRSGLARWFIPFTGGVVALITINLSRYLATLLGHHVLIFCGLTLFFLCLLQIWSVSTTRRFIKIHGLPRPNPALNSDPAAGG